MRGFLKAISCATLLAAALLFTPVVAQDVNNPNCNGAWTAYTATATAATPGITPPTLTVNGARYKLCGNKTVLLQNSVSVTAAGTGVGALRVTLPFTAAAFPFTGSSFEFAVTGVGGIAQIASNGTFVAAVTAAGASYIVTGQGVSMTVTYEIP